MRIPGLKAGASVGSACEALTLAFRAGGIESPQADARILVGHALGLERARMLAESDRSLEAREADAIAARASRRLAREPVARIVGTKEFWSLPLAIGPSVLVPRPETETVVEAALAALKDRSRRLQLLDIGTGSGALLLALLSELPHAFGIGTDINTAALSLARANATRLKLDARCAFVACDIAAALRGPLDLIVSNPPYIASAEIETLEPEVRAYDPRQALDGGADGLSTYRLIAADARRLLAPRGWLVVELGRGQETAVAALLVAGGLVVPDPARKDLGGTGRALSAIAP